jgi:hypothetical protein
VSGPWPSSWPRSRPGLHPCPPLRCNQAELLTRPRRGGRAGGADRPGAALLARCRRRGPALARAGQARAGGPAPGQGPAAPMAAAPATPSPSDGPQGPSAAGVFLPVRLPGCRNHVTIPWIRAGCTPLAALPALSFGPVVDCTPVFLTSPGLSDANGGFHGSESGIWHVIRSGLATCTAFRMCRSLACCSFASHRESVNQEHYRERVIFAPTDSWT